MHSVNRLILAVAACGLLSSALAQDVRVDTIPGVETEPHVQSDPRPAQRTFVGDAARLSDPRAADMIAALRGIKVRVYERLADPAATQSFVDSTAQTLEQSGWERVVFVQDGDDKVRVHALVEGDQMVGMTFMIVDSSDAVFISIDGQIDPAQLGRVAAAMGFGDVIGSFFGGGQGARASRNPPR